VKIAFIGIGLMGRPMVTRLLNAGFEMVLWNRSAEKSAAFSERAIIANTPSEALKNADIIITMLENGDVVHDVIFKSDAFRSIKPNALFIDMSSIAPSVAKKHAQVIKSQGAAYLDAPVSGGTVGAEQGSLSVMAGGLKADFDQASPIFSVLGTATHIGDIGCGQLCKLANQAIVGITIGAVSEALLLASEGGADPQAVRTALGGGFAASRILELHGQRMIDRDFQPGATARVQLKDLRTLLDEARAENLSLPLSQRCYESYLSLVANGHENIDHSGLLLELEQLNNTQLKTGKATSKKGLNNA
jgi:2-hydroxy-3-oxopropionate reductase